ncbi:hypothetical protein L1049_022536 [Liquidambar formosana]|uniref:Transmembrane protein n=1 Tax=Liquidambar formosana TaxID=63359 RepID=A0AAP0WP57_LIQFO
MHRSSSTSRVSDEFFNHSSSSPAPPVRPTSDADKLPTYNPDSHVAKKERSRLRSAENAIHLIPLVLVLCAIILWFFSKQAVDIVNKGDSNVARIKDLTINGDVDSDGTQSSLRPNLKLENFNPTKHLVDQKPTKLLEDKSM